MPTPDRQRNPQPPEAAALARCKRRRMVILLPLTLAGAGFGILSLHHQAPALVWNFTESVPVGLYSVAQAAPDRGELVAVMPDGEARMALDSFGALPTGRYLLKPLAAVAGDTVCRDQTTITINGIFAATARRRTRTGELLPSWNGCQVLRENEILLLAPHPASFDGRYFGPTDRDTIAGIARPIFTLPLSREAR